MQNLTTTREAIIEKTTEKLTLLGKDLDEKLEKGDFKGFENDLKKVTDDLHDDLAESAMARVMSKASIEKKPK